MCVYCNPKNILVYIFPECVYNIFSKYKWQRQSTENDPLNYIYKKVMDSEKKQNNDKKNSLRRLYKYDRDRMTLYLQPACAPCNSCSFVPNRKIFFKHISPSKIRFVASFASLPSINKRKICSPAMCNIIHHFAILFL